jgi:hypothetical protein
MSLSKEQCLNRIDALEAEKGGLPGPQFESARLYARMITRLGQPPWEIRWGDEGALLFKQRPMGEKNAWWGRIDVEGQVAFCSRSRGAVACDTTEEAIVSGYKALVASFKPPPKDRPIIVETIRGRGRVEVREIPRAQVERPV